MKILGNLTVLLFCCLSLLFFPPAAPAGKFNVLVVMSYEQDNPWCREIKEGIESVFADGSELTFFYMDTKKDLQGGEKKAKEALALLEELKPDGIITVDDNAQWMFAVPFLRDKSTVPVMFCGVNAEASKYGYPATNISGVLERGHIREGLAFAKQLYPSLNRVLILAKDSPSGKALQRQVRSESESYLVNITDIKLVRSVNELLAAKAQINEVDALFIDSMEGIVDEKGSPMSNAEVTDYLSQHFFKPIIGANQYHVREGALCAVVKTGQEQGATAAEMLLTAMQGTPVAKIPIRKNYKGKRVINVTVMKKMDLTPSPMVLLGAELVTTGK